MNLEKGSGGGGGELTHDTLNPKPLTLNCARLCWLVVSLNGVSVL